MKRRLHFCIVALAIASLGSQAQDTVSEAPDTVSSDWAAQAPASETQYDSINASSAQGESPEMNQPVVAAAQRPVMVITQASPRSSDERYGLETVCVEYLQFRLGAFRGISVLDNYAITERTGETFGGSPTVLSGKQAGATHALVVKCSPISGGKSSVSMTLEALSESGENFVCNSPGATDAPWQALDSCLKSLLAEMEMAPSKIAQRFLEMPVVGTASTAAELMRILQRASGAENAKRTASDLEALVNKDPRSYLAAEGAIRRFADAGDYDKASRLAEALVTEIGPYHAGVYALAARIYRLAKKPAESYRIVKVAQQMQMETPELDCEKAMALEAMDDLAGAADAYRHVIAADERNPRANQFLIRHFQEQGEHQEAVVLAERFSRANPSNVDARIALARSLLSLGRHDDAGSPLQEALVLEPSNVEAHVLTGDLEVARGRPTEALASYRSALSVLSTKGTADSDNPHTAEVYVKTSRILRATGNPAAARELISPIEDAFYENVEVQKEIGLAAYAAGDSETSRRCLSRCLSNGDADTAVLIRMAELNRAAGDNKQALTLYRQVEESRPNDAQVREAIASLQNAGQDSDRRTRPARERRVSLRIPLSIVAGVVAAGACGTGIFFDQRVKTSVGEYHSAQSKNDAVTLRDETETNSTYRNILYSLSAVAAVGCGVTILIPSRK